MASLLERYATRIAGTLSCYDRLIITGTLAGVCYAQGMTRHLHIQGIRVFDFPQFADKLRLRLRDNAETIAQEHGLSIEHIRSAKAFRKEERIAQVLKERGEAPGLVHIFSAMEPCTAFRPWHDKITGKTYLRYTDGKCLHYYFYFIDPDFGLCYLRVPTWAPFRLQFYCNGHNWLAFRLQAESIAYTRADNAFISCQDWPRAQELADSFPVEQLHALLDQLAALYCPVLEELKSAYRWSIMQAEYATDIVFGSQEALRPLYDSLVRTAIHAVKAPDVAMFLGRKLNGNYQGELGTDFHTRIEGTRIKHHMKQASIKMYDKLGTVLRIETTANDVTFFSHYRTVEHRDGTSERKYAPMQKTIYSLGALREVLAAANRRYLAFISELSDPSGSVRDVHKLSDPVRRNGRSYRGFNLFAQEDLELLIAINQGQFCVNGITNRQLRRLLPEKTGGQLSRLLKRLRVHGLIKKVGKTYHYYFTKLGQKVVLTALKLRELVVIPALAQAQPA